MMTEIERPLEGDFIGWLVIIAAIAITIGIVLWVAKAIDNREKQRLGRRTDKPKKAKPDNCYKKCSMIASYQNCLLEHEREEEALRLQNGYLQRRCAEKELIITELRTELYAAYSKIEKK